MSGKASIIMLLSMILLANPVVSQKFLPKNEAEEFLEFDVRQSRKKVELKWASSVRVDSMRFHVLKGRKKNNNQITWEMIGIVDVERGNKKKFSFQDEIEMEKVYYRLMISDKEDEIKYTSIITFKSDIG